MSERRRRVDLHVLPGDLPDAPPRLRCEIDGKKADADLGDLSVLGVFVQLADPVAVDTELNVALKFSDATFAMRGHVVQSVPQDRALAEGRKAGFALLFEHVDETERARMRKRIDAALALHAASLRPARLSTPKPSQLSKPSPPTASASGPAPATTAPAAPKPSAEEHALLDKLRGELQALAGKTPWEILGVSQGADEAAAKQAFFAASKRYHPHLYSRYQLPELKQVVTELFIAHKRANDAMSRKASARQTQPIRVSVRPPMNPPTGGAQGALGNLVATLRSRSPLPATHSPVPARHSPLPTEPRAERSASRASSDLSALEGALRPPMEPKFRDRDAAAFVHDALKRLAQARFDEAEAHLEKALALDPLSPNARVWLLVTQARRAKHEGNADDAVARYKEVLVLDPKHHEALTELKRNTKPSGPGLIGRFFGGGNEEK